MLVVLLWVINMSIVDEFKAFLSSKQQPQQGAVATGKVEDAQKPKVDYTDVVHYIESKRGKRMNAPTSSATGHFQFIDSTWNAYVKQHKLGYSLEDRNDFEKSKKVFELYTEDNRKQLRNSLKREPNNTETYMAHKLGPGVASVFMKAEPTATVDKVVNKAALRANKNVFYNKDGSPKKVKEVYSYFNEFFRKPPEQ